MKFKRFLAVSALFAAVFSLDAAPKGKQFAIAAHGEALGHIAIDVDAARPIQHAARELQNCIKLISSALYPIQHNTNLQKPVTFVLGTRDSEVVKPLLNAPALKMLDKLQDDGFAVLVRGRKILLIGNNPRGVINAVNRFIYKHTDFIWVRPGKELAHYTFDPDLKISVSNCIDNPKFKARGWSTPGRAFERNEELRRYFSRLNCNWTPGSSPAHLLGQQLDNGIIMEYGGGHNLSRLWMPVKKYGKTNPEFYMMIKGKRETAGRLQLCYSNKDMVKACIKETIGIVKNLPPYFVTANILIDDTQAYCQCAECEKPIILPDGRKLLRSEESFQSTQFYLFLNEVARAVAKVRPDLKIKTFGYFFTAVPPEIPVEKNIIISFCPYVRNDKESLHGSSNSRWLQRINKYARMSPGVIWREYYFGSAHFPKAQANIIAQDLSYINKIGVRMIYAPVRWADSYGYPGKTDYPEQDFYTMCGPEFWTVNQLFWDPAQDPDQLRNEYLKRTYRDGAPGIIKFYKLLRDSWLNDPTPAAFNDEFKRCMGHYVLRKKLLAPCREALAEAQNSVRDPRAKVLVGKLVSTFERWVTLANDSIVAEQKVPKVNVREFPGFEFDSGVWSKAGKLPPLTRMGNPKLAPSEPTDVKVMHNSSTLYVAFRCPFPGNVDAAKNSPRDQWPGGDHGEVFIGNERDGYYHLVFNCWANGQNGICDAKATDRTWNTEWEVKTQMRNGEWRAVVAIPLKSVKITVEENNRVRALFYRCRPARSKKEHNVHSSWGGGQVHSAGSFGELVFDLE